MNAFFKPYQPGQPNRLHTGWLWFLFLAGALVWCVFLNWGNIPFDFHDWAEINAPRTAFLADAMRQGVLPWHMADASALRNLTDRFMAIPDVLLSPQIILLRWLDVGTFTLVNLLLLYAIGFAGLVRLMKQFRLSALLFTIIFLLFNFNGHIISHLSVGHTTWMGYFLLPWFFLLLMVLPAEQSFSQVNWRWTGAMALLLAVMFLQGSFHQYLWCLLFMGAFALASWRDAMQIVMAALFSGLLLLFRFLPVTLLFGQFDTEFRGGYPRPWHVVQALLVKQVPATSQPEMNFNSPLGYWEFDAYIGVVGGLILAGALIFWLAAQARTRHWSPWLVPILLLAAFSIHKAYLPLSLLPIPILNGERVTSRFLIMPLLASLLVILPQYSAWFTAQVESAWRRTASILLTAYLAIDLVWQTLEWQVTEAFKAFPFTTTDLSIKVVGNHPDEPYTRLVLLGVGLSIAAVIFLLFMMSRQHRTAVITPTKDSD